MSATAINFPAVSAPAPAAASLATPSFAASGAAPTTQAPAKDDGESFFSELLDIVNPLQHLPVIGTIYRAITGDHIDGFAKVAGDALYGGMWGAIGGAADVAFQAITGKSAEDTVLAWFDSSDQSGGDKTGDQRVRVAAGAVQVNRLNLRVASALPALPVSAPDSVHGPLTDSPTVNSTGTLPKISMPPVELAAFTGALADKGVTGQTAQRALYAYQRSIALTGQPVTSLLN